MTEAAPLLALLLTSPGEKPSAPELLERLAGGGPVGLVLAQSGVYWLTRAEQVEKWRAADVKLYARARDLTARGLADPPQGVTLVEETDLARLIMEDYPRSVTL